MLCPSELLLLLLLLRTHQLLRCQVVEMLQVLQYQYIATDVDPESLQVISRLNGEVRQDYPVNDMFFSPLELVQRISRGMTLLPGDLITCATSLGASPMKPGATIEIVIDGIGTLSNTFA